MSRLACVLGALGCLASANYAQVRPQGRSYLLRMAFAKGKKADWSMSIVYRIGEKAAPTKATSPLQALVEKLTGQGAQVKVTTGPMTMGGAKMSEAQSASVQLDRRGNAVGSSFANGALIVFPKGPVKLGQSWTGKTTLAGGISPAGALAVEAKYTLLRVSKGKAEIMMVLASKGNPSIVGSGVAQIDVSDGWMLSSTLDLTMSSKPSRKGAKPFMAYSTVKMERK